MEISTGKKRMIKNLVLEGGGVLGIAYSGALLELESHIDLGAIENVAGSSAGSIAAAALAAGASTAYIAKTMAVFDIVTR
jgi:NTE family protein